jgi:purine-binding chemotaxis protein CheW
VRVNNKEESRPVAARPTATPNEVLTLRLGGEEHGIDVPRVQEIRSFEPPTRIAGAPPHVLGVTNLRGVIVPIVDLRSPLALDAGFDSGTVTVVLNVCGRTVGAVVDAVGDVVQLGANDVSPAPEFNRAVAASHILGIAAPEQAGPPRMLILVDVEQLMTSHEMGLVDAALH